MSHDDVVDIGMCGGEMFCPFNLEGIVVGRVSLVVVVVAVGVFSGIVFFAIVGTPTIAESIAKTWYHQVAEEPLGCATFEYVVYDACGEAFFTETMSMSKIEMFALDVDEFACFVHY